MGGYPLHDEHDWTLDSTFAGRSEYRRAAIAAEADGIAEAHVAAVTVDLVALVMLALERLAGLHVDRGH